MFAKLFNTPFGQILLTKETSEEDHPEIELQYECERLGRLTTLMTYINEGTAEQERDTAFEAITEEKALELLKVGLEVYGEAHDNFGVRH